MKHAIENLAMGGTTSALVLTAALLAGCQSTGEGATGGSGSQVSPVIPEPPPAWTGVFLEPAEMLARRIEITGPAGLVDHCTTTRDPGRVIYTAETTESGFEQRLSRAPGMNELVPLRGTLDQWHLVATDLLVLREDPSVEGISVRAEGDVFLLRGDDQVRKAFFELDVPIGAPPPVRAASSSEETVGTTPPVDSGS